MTTRSPVSARIPAPSAPRMRGFGTDGSPFADPEIEMVQRRRAQLDEDFTCARDGIRRVLVAEHLRAAVLVDANRLHRRGTLPG